MEIPDIFTEKFINKHSPTKTAEYHSTVNQNADKSQTPLFVRRFAEPPVYASHPVHPKWDSDPVAEVGVSRKTTTQ